MSETYEPSLQQSMPPSPRRVGLFSNLVRRKKAPDQRGIPSELEPPPPPPKDTPGPTLNPPSAPDSRHIVSSSDSHPPITPIVIKPRGRSSSLSELAMLSNTFDSPETNNTFLRPSALAQKLPCRPPDLSKVRPKWISDLPTTSDPTEKARRRIELEKRRRLEQEHFEREEAVRQSRLQLEKQREFEEERVDQERRRLALEATLKVANAERSRKERELIEEEQARLANIEERKRRSKEKRLEEWNRAENWRKEQAERLQDAAKRKVEERKLVEEDRQMRLKLVAEQLKNTPEGDSYFSGWLTLQTTESLIWKRRFYKLTGSTLLLYRSPAEMDSVLDKLDLYNRLTSIREWDEGYEELKAIPHAFAIEFSDGQGSWSLFSDSQMEKEKLQGLLYKAIQT